MSSNNTEIQYQELLHEYVKAFSVFSHEMRPPISQIRGYAELLAYEHFGKLNEDQQKAVDFIKSASDRMNSQ